MPTLRVELFEGRTEQQKAARTDKRTQACVEVLGGDPESVDVIFFDIARRDWATGGELWSRKGQPKAVE